MAKPTKYVYQPQGTGAKTFWFKVGAVFENKDGSDTLILNCYPLPGEDGKVRLQIRPAEEGRPQAKDDARAPRFNDRDRAFGNGY